MKKSDTQEFEIPEEEIKIADDSHKAIKTDDTTELVEELVEKKRTGKLDKARVLGENIAVAVCSGQIITPEGASEDMFTERLRSQARLLLAFAVSVGLDEVTSSELTARTALSVFYDTLKKDCPALYESLNSSAAISMYYLAFRRGGNVDEAIGKTFAALCGEEDSMEHSLLGRELYIHFLATIYREAAKLDLAKDQDE